MTDYISRADAISIVHSAIEAEIPFAIVADLIKGLPSADAVHGEWIIRENGNKECSLCGHERQDGWDYFCGYCGARMKGGAE